MKKEDTRSSHGKRGNKYKHQITKTTSSKANGRYFIVNQLHGNHNMTTIIRCFDFETTVPRIISGITATYTVNCERMNGVSAANG